MFFRKKEKKVEEAEKTASRSVDEINEEIIQCREDIKSGINSNNKLANLYIELGDIDAAIKILEEVLEKDKTLGKNFNDLMKCYNMKRKEAAFEKDDVKIQLYLDKIDALLKLQKDVIRGRV